MSSADPDFAMCLPAPALRPYISHYVGFRAEGLRPGTHSGLPSHHLGLIISLSKPIDIIRMPDLGTRPAAFTAFVSGLNTGPTTVGYGDTRDGLFIHLTPPGVRAVLGVKSIELSWATRS